MERFLDKLLPLTLEKWSCQRDQSSIWFDYLDRWEEF